MVKILPHRLYKKFGIKAIVKRGKKVETYSFTGYGKQYLYIRILTNVRILVRVVWEITVLDWTVVEKNLV
jgi:hypothetical protein